MVAFNLLNAGYQAIGLSMMGAACPPCSCDCGCQCSCTCWCECPCDCNNYASLHDPAMMPDLDSTYKDAKADQNGGGKTSGINSGTALSWS